MKIIRPAINNVAFHIQFPLRIARVDQNVQGGANKFLAQPGRKDATMTKLGIYSTSSPRSSIHFLDPCSNFCKTLKKNSEGCPSNQVSAARMTSASDKKWGTFNCCFFSVQGTRPDPENRVGDHDTGTLGRPISSGLQVPGEPGALSYKNKIPFVIFRWRFSFKISFNCASRDE